MLILSVYIYLVSYKNKELSVCTKYWGSYEVKVKKGKATGCHLLHRITQCYLSPDTSECAPPNPGHAGWYSIYLSQSDGRLSWPSWLDSAPAGSRTSDLSITSPTPNHCTTKITDVTSVWLVLWQLCIARRFETWHLIETRHSLENGPQNSGVYWRPGVYLGPAFIRSVIITTLNDQPDLKYLWKNKISLLKKRWKQKGFMIIITINNFQLRAGWLTRQAQPASAAGLQDKERIQ